MGSKWAHPIGVMDFSLFGWRYSWRKSEKDPLQCRGVEWGVMHLLVPEGKTGTSGYK